VLYVFGFESICVAVSDLYVLSAEPAPGQEGAERGVRLEVRMLERAELRGSAYSSRPIGIGRPIWRADLLESVDGPAGSYDRTHHHPGAKGWEPGQRRFVEELSSDPLGWVEARLGDLDGLLDEATLGAATPSSHRTPRWRRLARVRIRHLPALLRVRLLARQRPGDVGRQLDRTEVDPRDGASLRAAAPEIMASVSRLMDRVRSGHAAVPPAEEVTSARVGWL
jgi:hypothetical protein